MPFAIHKARAPAIRRPSVHWALLNLIFIITFKIKKRPSPQEKGNRTGFNTQSFECAKLTSFLLYYKQFAIKQKKNLDNIDFLVTGAFSFLLRFLYCKNGSISTCGTVPRRPVSVERNCSYVGELRTAVRVNLQRTVRPCTCNIPHNRTYDNFIGFLPYCHIYSLYLKKTRIFSAISVKYINKTGYYEP